MAGKNFVISVILNGVNNLGPAVRNAQGALNGFARGTQAVQERMNRIARPMMVFGAATTGALALGARAFSDFEDSATRTALLTGEVGDSFQKNYDRIAGISKRLAVTVGEGPKAVTESLNMMIQAGLEPADKNLEQLSTNILKFARVTNIGAAESIDRVLGITNAMIGPVRNSNTVIEDTTRTMTSLRNVSVATMVDMDDMTTAVARVAPYAKNAGLTIEETSALVGSFGDEMIRGGVAATRLQQMLFGLTIRTPKAIKALEDIGVSPYDKRTGELRNFLDVWDDLYKVTKSMPPEARNMLFGAVFTRRAAGGAMSLFDLYNKMPDKIRNLVKEAQRSANLWKAFDIQMATTKGQFDILRSTIQVFIIDAMEPLVADAIKPLVLWTMNVIKSLSVWAKANVEPFKWIVRITAAVGALSLGIGGALWVISTLIGMLGSLVFGLALFKGLLGPGTVKALLQAAANAKLAASTEAAAVAQAELNAQMGVGVGRAGQLGGALRTLGMAAGPLAVAAALLATWYALEKTVFEPSRKADDEKRRLNASQAGLKRGAAAMPFAKRSQVTSKMADEFWTKEKLDELLGPKKPVTVPPSALRTTAPGGPSGLSASSASVTVNIKADKGLKPSITDMKTKGGGFNFGATLLQGSTTPAQGLP